MNIKVNEFVILPFTVSEEMEPIMSRLRKTILSALFVLLLFPALAVSQDKQSDHEFGATIAFTTNYMFRGVTQSDNKPAGQGEISYAYNPLGFYAFIWASNVDFDDDDTNIEIDYGFGFAGEFSNKLGWDVGFLYYNYPDSSNQPDLDYLELYAGLSYTLENLPMSPALGGKFSYSPDYFGEDGDAIYIEGDISFSLPYDIALAFHVGYLDVDGEDTSGPEGLDYTGYSVGLSKEIFGLNADVTYTNTGDQTDACGDTNWCDAHVVFSLSKDF